jgi:transcriptional regulator with XRE-family HTH domain
VARPSPAFAGNDELKALGEAVRRLRLARNLSQEALAHDAGIDRSYLGGIERGEHNVAMMNLLKICAVLDVRLSQLLADSGL